MLIFATNELHFDTCIALNLVTIKGMKREKKTQQTYLLDEKGVSGNYMPS